MAEPLDRLELSEGFLVAGAIHGLFGGDERVKGEYVEPCAFNVNLLTGLLDLLVAPDALDLVEAVQPPDVRVEVKVLEVSGVLGRQLQRLAARRHSVHGMDFSEPLLQCQKVRRREVAADVDVLGDIRAAVDNAGVAADDDEVHAGTGKSLQQV